MCPHACNSSIPEPGERGLHLSAVTGGQDLVAGRDLGPVVPAARMDAGQVDVVEGGAGRGHEALRGAGEQGRVGKGAGPACTAGLDGAVPAWAGRIAAAFRAKPVSRGRRPSTARDKMSSATGFDGSKCFGRRADDPGATGVRPTIPGRRPTSAALAGLVLFQPDRAGARAPSPEQAAGIAALSRKQAVSLPAWVPVPRMRTTRPMAAGPAKPTAFAAAPAFRPPGQHPTREPRLRSACCTQPFSVASCCASFETAFSRGNWANTR